MAQEQGRQEKVKQYGQLVAQAWRDPAFKQRLLADPKAVFAERGIGVPAGPEVKMVENTDQVLYFVLPRPPARGELSDEKLDQVAAGLVGVFCPCGRP